jgi:hypothetical protein
MVHGAFRLPAIVLAAAGLVSLLPLVTPSLAVAKTEVHHQGSAAAIHRSAGAAAHVVQRAGASGHRVVSSRGRTVASSRRYGYGRHYRYGGYAVAGSSSGSYSGDYGYGYSYHRSCGWYYSHEPYNLPYRCRAHDYSYGYAEPSYGYSYAYGSSSGYGHQAGGAWRGGHSRHYAVHGGSHRMMTASVRPHGGAHMVAQGGPRMVAHGGPHPVAHGGHAHGHLP